MSAVPAEPPGRVVRRGLGVIAMAIRLQPKSFTVAVAGAALYGAMTIGQALVFGRITDRVILPAFRTGATTRGALALAATAIMAVALLKTVGIVARRVGATYMQLRLTADFRERVTARYQQLPLSWHRRHSTGELLSNANADVEATFWPIAPLPFSCGVLLMLAITLAILIVTDLFLTGVALVVGPLLALLNWRYNRLIEDPATQAQEYRAEVSGVAHESFDGALVVKTLGRETAETQRFARSSERLRDELVRYGRLRALFDPLMEALPNVGVLAILAVGAYRIASGNLSEGDLVQFAYLFTLLAFPIRAIGWVLSEMPRSVVGWDRIARVLDADGRLEYGAESGSGARTPAGADLVEVAFRYADSDILHDVTFRASPGRTIAMVGPTGSGKSTIASLLVRLADPDQGEVRLDGQDLRTLRRGAVATNVAIVFQHTFLFDDTIRGNITLGDEFTDEEVRAAARLAQADGFVEALPDGYETLVGERGASLSGGQRQRIALARALVRRPRLLILDDATSSVDTAVEADILRGLKEAALPSTVVVVAYRKATIELADEIVFVAGGRIADTGTHDELVDRLPGYARLVSAYADEARRRASESEAAERP